MQWCMTLFNNLDNALTEFMASTFPRLRKHEARLEVLEEKVEILATWVQEIHLSRGVEGVHGGKQWREGSSTLNISAPGSVMTLDGIQSNSRISRGTAHAMEFDSGKTTLSIDEKPII